MIDGIVERTLKQFADNYHIASNDGERFKTDRESTNFIEATVKAENLREHYMTRYQQYKDTHPLISDGE